MQKCVSHSVVYDSLGPRQTPLSMGFSGKNTGVDCHSLLQGIFPTQGWNLGLPHCGHILYRLSYQRSPFNHYDGFKSLLTIVGK